MGLIAVKTIILRRRSSLEFSFPGSQGALASRARLAGLRTFSASSEACSTGAHANHGSGFVVDGADARARVRATPAGPLKPLARPVCTGNDRFAFAVSALARRDSRRPALFGEYREGPSLLGHRGPLLWRDFFGRVCGRRPRGVYFPPHDRLSGQYRACGAAATLVQGRPGARLVFSRAVATGVCRGSKCRGSALSRKLVRVRSHQLRSRDRVGQKLSGQPANACRRSVCQIAPRAPGQARGHRRSMVSRVVAARRL